MTGRPILRRAAGWLGAVLGFAGVLVSLAGLVAVCLLYHHIDRPLEGVVRTFIEAADGATAAATNVAGHVQVARGSVSALDERVAGLVRERLAFDDADVARIDAAREQVRLVVDRARAWAQLAGTSLVLIEQFAGMVDSVAGLFRGGHEERRSLAAVVAKGRVEIAVAEQLLVEFGDKLAEVRAGPGLPEHPVAVQKFTVRIGQSLEALQRRVEGFGEGVATLKLGVTNLQARIHRIVRLSAVALALLLVWQAAAQVCLARAGWRLRVQT
jgi:hypothetical protein